MIVQDLPAGALAARLQGSGLRVRTGPVVTSIRSPLRAVWEGVSLHYALHGVEPDDGFVDFHVAVDRPDGARRWLKPQVQFQFDGSLPFTPLPGDQGFPLLEWGLNWCVTSHSHQYLILHAAVLERHGRALLMPAPSGSGKSTLCAGLAYAGGWRLLSDELALIEPATGLVWPLPRPVSLKNASIDVIRELAPSAQFGREVHETVKGRVVHVRSPPSSILLAHEPVRPGWVVLPRFEPGAQARLEPLSRALAFMQLVDNAFNYHVHGRNGFNVIADLIERCICHQFTYSDLPQAIQLFEGMATITE